MPLCNFGRKVIKTTAAEITDANVVNEVVRAASKHLYNQADIQYLWDYYKGKQPILEREKKVRPDINNKIVENRANEIVAFKVGYLCGEPIQYVGKTADAQITESINRLNDLMAAEDKATQDQELVEWQMICGTAYRLVIPNRDASEADERPFEMYTLDPRDTFVVYSDGVDSKPMFAVKYSTDENLLPRYSVYTDSAYYEIFDTSIVRKELLLLGMVPIFEYPANSARLGAFEIVLPLLDALNTLASNRLDATEQVVQAFMKFINCDITKEEFEQFLEMGAIRVKSTDGANADVDMVTTNLNQTQTQTLKGDLYESILTICGLPNRNGSSSTSDTGSAVLLRDGWSTAESRAKSSENAFKRSERQMLKLIMKICSDLNLKPTDIQLQFTRRNYENIQSKSQVLVSMLQQPKIHPLLAFQHSGMFVDPERAYVMSMDYYEQQMKQWEPVEVDENDEDVSGDGSISEPTEESNQKGIQSLAGGWIR